MDITERVSFDEVVFDLVNARLLVGFMIPHQWPPLLAECMRILKPGGMVCLTEAEWGITNSNTFERYTSLASLALKHSGQSFSPNGLHLELRRYQALFHMPRGG
jgi:ubiquinone/menaquinone biosynthesis C-methylase UbiE